jgi:hypothetical protein
MEEVENQKEYAEDDRERRAHGNYGFSPFLCTTGHFLILFANLLSGRVVRIWLARGGVSPYWKAGRADITPGEKRTERTTIPYYIAATPCVWHLFSSNLLRWEFDVFFCALGSSLDDPCLFSQNQE